MAYYYIMAMNTNHIHIVVVLLLLSLTVHEAHAATSHETEACEVCIHIQSNDDVLPVNSPQYILIDSAFHLKLKAQYLPLKNTIDYSADFIRGPPQFSFI